jgi:hypothetical protein
MQGRLSVRATNADQVPAALSIAATEWRLAWTIRVVALGFLFDLWLTPQLWLDVRSYPLTPVGPLPPIPPPWDDVAFFGLIAANALLLLMPMRRWPAALAFAWYLLYSLWDQQRWVPFFNEMAAFYLAFAFRRTRETEDDASSALATCAVVIAFIYVWSGLQKLNWVFFTESFPWMMAPFERFVPGVVFRNLTYLGPGIALLETSIGVMLLTVRWRCLGVVLGLLMHAFILLSAGPLGNNGNTQVWSWNVAAGVLLVLVFWASSMSAAELLNPRRGWVHVVALVFFAVMPIFNVMQIDHFKWDDFQAATLYSGNEERGTIYFAEQDAGRVPEHLRDMIWRSEEDGRLFIRILDWAYADLNVPDYHADRIYLSVMRGFCRQTGPGGSFVLEIGSMANRLTGDRQITRYVCGPAGTVERLDG